MRGQARGIAYVDITTGEFAATQIAGAEIAAGRAARAGPPGPGGDGAQRRWRELPGARPGCRSAPRWPGAIPTWPRSSVPLTLYDDWRFELGNCRQALLDHFQVTTLAGYGCEDLPLAIRAAGVLVQYLRQHQPAPWPSSPAWPPTPPSAFMTLDAATRRNLELTETIRDRSVKGSLLGVLDETLTPMGGRLLRRWISQPLLDLAALEAAADGRGRLLSRHGRGARRCATLLRNYGDLERLTNRVVQGIALPRELLGLKAALETRAARSAACVQRAGGRGCAVQGARRSIPWTASGSRPRCRRLSRSSGGPSWTSRRRPWPTAGSSAAATRRAGRHRELGGRGQALGGQPGARGARAHRHQDPQGGLQQGLWLLPGDDQGQRRRPCPADYIRKQTLVNAERYITPELKEREALILNAAERTQELEAALYRELLADIGAHGRANSWRRRGPSRISTSTWLWPRWRPTTAMCAPS